VLYITESNRAQNHVSMRLHKYRVIVLTI